MFTCVSCVPEVLLPGREMGLLFVVKVCFALLCDSKEREQAQMGQVADGRC